MANKSLKGNKETRLLVKIIFKIYKHYGVEGTWKFRQSGKHWPVSWSYKKERFSTTIGSTPRNNSTQFQTVRTELRRIGLDKGNNKYWSDMKVLMSGGVDSNWDEMNSYLSALEQLVQDNRRKGTYEKSQNSYRKDVLRVQPRKTKPKDKKPYKQIIYRYDEYGREIQHIRYYVWRKYNRRDDAEVNGYITSTKSRFDMAMKNYKKKKH